MGDRSEASECSKTAQAGTALLTAARAALLGLWYSVVVAPDAQTYVHRAFRCAKQRNSTRLVDGVRGVLQLATLPAAAMAAVLGRAKVARIASLAIFVNPPTLLISALVMHDVAHAVLGVLRRPHKSEDGETKRT